MATLGSLLSTSTPSLRQRKLSRGGRDGLEPGPDPDLEPEETEQSSARTSPGLARITSGSRRRRGEEGEGAAGAEGGKTGGEAAGRKNKYLHIYIGLGAKKCAA